MASYARATICCPRTEVDIRDSNLASEDPNAQAKLISKHKRRSLEKSKFEGRGNAEIKRGVGGFQDDA